MVNEQGRSGDSKALTLWRRILMTSLAIPGATVDRDSFLMSQFAELLQ